MAFMAFGTFLIISLSHIDTHRAFITFDQYIQLERGYVFVIILKELFHFSFLLKFRCLKFVQRSFKMFEERSAEKRKDC